MFETTSIYIVATPWNFLNAFLHASQRVNEKSLLMYVDFPIDQKNLYLKALDQLSRNSPFEETWCFHGKFKGVFNKWLTRKKELQEIQNIVRRFKPEQVFVGSDRRIEFQCAMTEAIKYKPVKGIYMEEGLFTYVCRKRSQRWSDRVLDSWVKRIVYPVDWKHPPTIGASDWIQEGYVLRPDDACKILKNKIVLNAINIADFSSPVFERLIQTMMTQETFDWLKAPFDVLLVLPHPSQLDDSKRQKIDEMVKNFVQLGKLIRVKRHPRDNSEFDLCEELPAHLPLELLAPWLSFNQLIASKSTASMTMKLLKPNLITEVI